LDLHLLVDELEVGLDVLGPDHAGALEHHVLEEVADPGDALALVRRSHAGHPARGDRGRLVAFEEQEAHAVAEGCDPHLDPRLASRERRRGGGEASDQEGGGAAIEFHGHLFLFEQERQDYQDFRDGPSPHVLFKRRERRVAPGAQRTGGLSFRPPRPLRSSALSAVIRSGPSGGLNNPPPVFILTRREDARRPAPEAGDGSGAGLAGVPRRALGRDGDRPAASGPTAGPGRAGRPGATPGAAPRGRRDEGAPGTGRSNPPTLPPPPPA